ncbi:MAG TPA: signal peptidase II [Methylomirabilota bacterium]|nr:signal peptidase II [Methylomirabilota bacterium]
MTGAPVADAGRGPLALGVVVLLVGFVLDQLTKLWVLFQTDLPDGAVIHVAPFVDFTLVWNRGISYGLMQQDSEFGRWVLVVFSIVAVVALSVWMWRTDRKLIAVSLALIVGGALGNLVDRVAYGAVVDFIYLHAFGYSWYVFNLADTWIVAGVAGLLYDSFKPGSG